MARESHIDIEGTITAAHGGGCFRVQCRAGGAGHEVLAQVCGRMRRNHIRVVPGDRVTVSVSPYDLGRGLITRRAR